jgi:Sigma 54 modulation/S30EA ribosomal protein C terminus
MGGRRGGGARRARTIAYPNGDISTELRPGDPATVLAGLSARAELLVVGRHGGDSPLPCTVDEAVAEMDDLDHDFHLFVEAGRGVDSIVHRTDPTGVRLAQVDGHADAVAPGAVPVTLSTVPAPLFDTAEAVDRLRFTRLPSCSTSTATTAAAACCTTGTTATTG